MNRYKQVIGHIDPQGKNTEFKLIYVEDKQEQLEILKREHNNTDLYQLNNYLDEQAETRERNNIALIKQLTIDFDLRLLVNDESVKLKLAEFLRWYSHANEIPIFHKIISSGRGLYIVYLIDNETNLKAYHSIGKALAKKLDKALASHNALIGLDPKNKKMDYKTIQAENLFRVEGSINSKSGEEVKTIDTGYREEPYTFRELLNYVDFTEKQKESVLNSFGSFQSDSDYVPRKRKLPKHFTEYTLYTNRVSDLATLQAIRKYRNYHIGYRNALLFYYGVALRIQEQDGLKIIKALREFNNDFKYPLSEGEVRATAKSVTEKKYIITNETMIDNLDIFKSEQRALKTIIGYSVKRERNRALVNARYKDTKETNKAHRERRNALILQMKQDNPTMSQQDIANELGISQMTVSRVLKKACL